MINFSRTALLLAAAYLCGSSPLYADDEAPARPRMSLTLTTGTAIDESAATGQDAATAAPAGDPVSASVLDLTKPPTSIWQRIRNGFGLPNLTNPLVREEEQWYAQRPDYVKRTIARSSRYLYFIVDELEKRGMPSEIALLPIIESAYNPVALSTAHASGIWQFIPSTGKLYGLQQNFWYDGRRDVVEATRAALDYLAKLYDMFGSWDLALASYNWGEGAVTRAIAKNVARGLPTDYQSLTLPTETRYYVPKLQAVKNIIAHPEQYGITLAEVPNQPYFVAVTASRHIDVKVAARLAGVPLDEFVSLNPGNSRPVIRVDGARALLVPADKADAFLSNLNNPREPLVSWQGYQLKAGETLERVAQRHGISVSRLKEVNGVSGKTRVGSGSTLLVPAVGGAVLAASLLETPNIVAAPAPAKKTAHAKTANTKVARANPRTGAPKVAHARTAVRKPATKVAARHAPPPRKMVLAQSAKPRLR